MKSEKEVLEGMDEVVGILEQAGKEERKPDLSVQTQQDLRRRVAGMLVKESSQTIAAPLFVRFGRAVALYAAALLVAIGGIWLYVAQRSDKYDTVSPPVDGVETAIAHLQHRLNHDMKALNRRIMVNPGRSALDLRSGHLREGISIRALEVEQELVRAGVRLPGQSHQKEEG